MKTNYHESKSLKLEQKLQKMELEILMFGLNSDPTSANVVAKRLHMKESPRNISAIKSILDRLVHEAKVYRSGSRYAIDFRGGLDLMKEFCFKISKENYKINNFVFENIISKHPL
jgi:hypothetical protein